MPKRNRLPILPDYFGIPKDYDKLVVQKSNPLQTLSETKLSLAQFKILDAYLSRIDSHDDGRRYVRLEKGELEKIIGVDRIRKEDLKERLENLFQTVTIKDENKHKGFTIIALFEKAEAIQDKDGLWQVDLACTESALEYIFNIENIGYLRYRLKNIVDLTSRYSYILYLYLENNRFRKSWKISLDELKRILNCNAESYTEGYKDFNKDILKRCQKELHEKTNLRFSYFPTDKKCRTYKSIQFTIEALENQIDSAENPCLSDGYDDYYEYPAFTESTSVYGGELADLLGEVACENEFTPQQIRVIQDLVLKAVGHDQMKCCDYLIHKMHLLDCYHAQNRFGYLITMLNNDIKKQNNQ